MKVKERFCGNCTSHNAYDYPKFVFCMLRFLNHENPVVPTLWRCEHWEHDAQDCSCVEEALKKRSQQR